MRTTLTLDPDVAELIAEEVHRRRQPFKQVVNDALRRGLSPRSAPKRPPPYEVAPHRARLSAGIDPGRFNQLADALDTAAMIRKLVTPGG